MGFNLQVHQLCLLASADYNTRLDIYTRKVMAILLLALASGHLQDGQVFTKFIYLYLQLTRAVP